MSGISSPRPNTVLHDTTNILKGKIAIITGAAQGMGAEHARGFVYEGGQVVLTDVQDEKGQELADSLGRPSCQDTGIPQFFARVGSNWPYMDIIEDALIDAVKEATAKAPLRPNAVEVFDEKNTGNNVGTHSPWIDWEIVKDSDELELYFYMACKCISV